MNFALLCLPLAILLRQSMNLMKHYIVLIFSLLAFQVSFGQNYLSSNEYHHRLFNGLSVMLINDSTATDLTLNLTIRTGAFTEHDSLNSLNYFYAQSFLIKNEIAPSNVRDVEFLQSRNIQFSTQVEPEQVTFHFQLAPQYLEETIKFLQGLLMNYQDTIPHLKLVKAQVNSDYNALQKDNLFFQNDSISQLLWENYYSRRQVITYIDSSIINLPHKLNEVQSRFYCPGNALLVIKGTMVVREAKKKVQEIMMDLDQCTFFHLFRYPILDHRYFTYSRQMVFETNVDTPFFKLVYQGPTVFKDIKGTYVSQLLQAILLDTTTQFYQYLTDSTYISDIKIETQFAYYSNEMALTVYTDSSQIDSAQIQLYELLNSGKWTSLVSEGDLEKGKQHLIHQFNLALNDANTSIDLVSKFWSSASVDYYSNYRDTIAALQAKDLENFSINYLRKAPHIAALFINEEERVALATDSFFAPTAGHVQDYEFQFLNNTAEFADGNQDSILQSLIQYLKINPKVKVKVNGIVSKDELMHIKDREMSDYVDSLGELHIYPKSTICGPKIRLDVYRALTIIKKLDEAGVPKNQLFGEGIIAKKPEEKENAQRVYCTLLSTIQLREE